MSLAKPNWIGIVAFVVCCVSFACDRRVSQARSISIGTHSHTMTVDNLERTYLVHVPPNYKKESKLPIVIVLHGFGGNAKNGLGMGHWIETSDRENFIAVGLDGTLKDPTKPESFLNNPRSWNVGMGIEGESQADDIGFIDAVIDDLINSGVADTNRIYITGFSNGAAMTYRAGAELSDRIAAIAPVSNSLLTKVTKLKHPVSLLTIWGTADLINPMAGGTVRRSRVLTPRPSGEASWRTWAKLLDCPLTEKNIDHKQGVKSRAFHNCRGGSEAVFYTVEGMGHTWPGGKNYLPESIIGKTSNVINATDLIWSFFKSHPR